MQTSSAVSRSAIGQAAFHNAHARHMQFLKQYLARDTGQAAIAHRRRENVIARIPQKCSPTCIPPRGRVRSAEWPRRSPAPARVPPRPGSRPTKESWPRQTRRRQNGRCGCTVSRTLSPQSLESAVSAMTSLDACLRQRPGPHAAAVAHHDQAQRAVRRVRWRRSAAAATARFSPASGGIATFSRRASRIMRAQWRSHANTRRP